MKRKRKSDGFSFDFSSLTFGNTAQEVEEIPKLTTEPAAFENAERMAESIDYDKDYFALVSGSFIFGDFIEALIYKHELAPSSVYITTLGMSKDNVDSIVNLVDYLGCGKVNLLVSNYFRALERHKLVPYMQREFAGKPVDVGVLASHCKIALIFSDKGNIMMSGSANLSSSNNVEQFIIQHDPATIAYVKDRLDSIMQRFTVYHGMEQRAERVTGNTGKKAFEAMTGGNE